MKSSNTQLPNETIIEVIAINVKTQEVIKKQMTFQEWLNLKKKKDFNYTPYQLGFGKYDSNSI